GTLRLRASSTLTVPLPALTTKTRLVRSSTATATGLVPTATVRSSLPLPASSTLTRPWPSPILRTKARPVRSSTATASGLAATAMVRRTGPAPLACASVPPVLPAIIPTSARLTASTCITPCPYVMSILRSSAPGVHHAHGCPATRTAEYCQRSVATIVRSAVGGQAQRRRARARQKSISDLSLLYWCPSEIPSQFTFVA